MSQEPAIRASELLHAQVVDSQGSALGRVQDVRIVRNAAGSGRQTRVVGLVVGGGRLAHACGFADGRAQGPWLLKVLFARSAREARFVPAGEVSRWGPAQVRLRVPVSELRSLQEELAS